MGDQWQSSLLNHHSSEAEGGPPRGQDYGVLGMQGTVSRNRRTTDTGYPDDGKLRFEDQEGETLPEEVTGEEVPSPRNPKVALPQLDRVLEKDADEGVSEMRWACPAGVGAVGGEQRSHPRPGVALCALAGDRGTPSVSCAGQEGGPSLASEANTATSRPGGWVEGGEGQNWKPYKSTDLGSWTDRVRVPELGSQEWRPSVREKEKWGEPPNSKPKPFQGPQTPRSV